VYPSPPSPSAPPPNRHKKLDEDISTTFPTSLGSTSRVTGASPQLGCLSRQHNGGRHK
jgi:hypothetical protein